MTGTAVEAADDQLAIGMRLPMLSIGLPVYNGALHLERALGSLLAQSFGDFELIVSDNASTDATPEICQDYAARDARVRYMRAPVNGGASWNFNRALALARAELFVWAAHDDEWHPDFLERCVGVLRRRPLAVACYSRYQLVTYDGAPWGDPAGIGSEGFSRRDRWRHVLRHWQVHPAVYAVMRTAAARRTRGSRPCLSWDLIFMSELILHGELVVLPEVLHWKRLPPKAHYRDRDDVMNTVASPGKRPWLFDRYGVLREELAGLKHAHLAKVEERMLARDAWVHYVTSRSWLYDGIESAKRLLGERGAKG